MSHVKPPPVKYHFERSEVGTFFMDGNAEIGTITCLPSCVIVKKRQKQVISSHRTCFISAFAITLKREPMLCPKSRAVGWVRDIHSQHVMLSVSEASHNSPIHRLNNKNKTIIL